MRIKEFEIGKRVRRKYSPINPALGIKNTAYPIGIAKSIAKRGTKYYVVVEFENRSEEIALDRLEYTEN